ncbi:MAG: electron transfer flavoprotein subunit beta/FixA family protein [Bdellovibrionota bacterium]
MNIAVCIKQVPDTSATISIKPDKKGIDESAIKWIINPYDEFAIEQALQLKEKIGDAAKVTVISVGPAKVQEALRTAMAMGCDEAVHIQTEDRWSLDHLSVSKVLAHAVQEAQAKLVFLGRHAIDDDSGHTGPMLATMLNWSQACFVQTFEWSDDHIQVGKDLEGGRTQTWKIDLPAVVTTTKGLNQPRYASLKGIMAAKKKPLHTKTLADVGVDASAASVTWSEFFVPVQERKRKIFKDGLPGDVEQVVTLLREEAKVL